MNCRFLYLIGQLVPGGAERQLHYLLRFMDRKRYKPAVAVWNFCETDVYVREIQKLGVPLYSLPRKSSAAAKLESFRRLVVDLRPQIVHSYSFYLNFAAHWAVWGTTAVAVGSVRSDFTTDKKDTGIWLGSLSARWPRNQICNSSAAAEVVRRSRSVFAPKRLAVIRNGLDLDSFRPVPLPRTRKRCIVGVGSLISVKRWDRLLAAALELKRRGFDFLVRIIGDGPLRGSLNQQAKILGVADCVELNGYSDNIPSLLADAAFLVHASDTEGCPNAVMEAMACGRAVAATDVGDVPLLVDDGVTGFVVRRGDDTALVKCMDILLRDHDLCCRMGEAGHAKAVRDFGLDRLVGQTLTAYRAVSSESL
jgi:glycosyltransferase involved in cell wall biosynthesis